MFCSHTSCPSLCQAASPLAVVLLLAHVAHTMEVDQTDICLSNETDLQLVLVLAEVVVSEVR
jgi:hypothetical protein